MERMIKWAFWNDLHTPLVELKGDELVGRPPSFWEAATHLWLAPSLCSRLLKICPRVLWFFSKQPQTMISQSCVLTCFPYRMTRRITKKLPPTNVKFGNGVQKLMYSHWMMSFDSFSIQKCAIWLWLWWLAIAVITTSGNHNGKSQSIIEAGFLAALMH